MAITKLLRIKENTTARNQSSGLGRCISYILNPEKTDNGRLVAGNAGGNADFIYNEMTANKIIWGKTDGSQGYHYVISFSPDEPVTHELALQIGQEFCQELLQGQYIYAAASHTDTPHAHCHIVFDSVNFQNGRKYHSGSYDWLAHIQPITDRICQKYGLSVLEFDMGKERKCLYHREWKDGQTHGEIKGNPSWNDVIRDDIDECISNASSWADFLDRLSSMHYEYHDGKYLSLKPFGKEKYIRSIRLGPGYSREELQARAGKPSLQAKTEGCGYRTYGDSVPLLRSAHVYIRKGHSLSPQQRLFYKRYFRIAHLRNPAFRGSWRYKKDICIIGSLASQAKYLFDNDITSIDAVKARLAELEKSRGREHSAERKLCRGILKEYSLSGNPGGIENCTDGYDAPLPSAQSVYQIRLNKVLFGTADFTQETFLARIPGTREYIRLYSDDTRIYNNGDTISAYIYAGAEYQVHGADGSFSRRITGEKAKELFKYRALDKKEENRSTAKETAHGRL